MLKKKYIGAASATITNAAAAAAAAESNDAMESEEGEIVDDGCSTTPYGKNSFKILSYR